MPTPTWTEYLAEATLHLSNLRASSELGLAPSSPPLRPVDPMPPEHREEVALLALGYDQLALEIVTRMQTMEPHRPGPALNNPHQERQPAHYLNTPL